MVGCEAEDPEGLGMVGRKGNRSLGHTPSECFSNLPSNKPASSKVLIKCSNWISNTRLEIPFCYISFFKKVITFKQIYKMAWASLVAQLVKNLPATQETLVWFLGREDPLEKG